MMQIRCQRCGWMFTLSREAIGLALAEAKVKDEHYHTVNCPQCRHVIKLQISEMQRRLPPDYVLPEWTPVVPEHVEAAPVAPPAAPAPAASAPAAPTPAAPVAEEKPKKRTTTRKEAVAAKPKAKAEPAKAPVAKPKTKTPAKPVAKKSTGKTKTGAKSKAK